MQIRDISQLIIDEDIDDVVDYMQILRRIGIAPSDTTRKGLDYSELLVKKNNGDQSQLVQMKLGALLCEKAALIAGVHAGQKRTAADVKKAAIEKEKSKEVK